MGFQRKLHGGSCFEISQAKSPCKNLQEAIDNPSGMVYNKNDEGTPATVAPFRGLKKITARLAAGGYLFALLAGLDKRRKNDNQNNDSQNGIGRDHSKPGASERSLDRS